MSLNSLKRDLAIINKALNIDTSNLRFSTWGEFNGQYLINLSETEQKQYWHLALKFALITNDIKNGVTSTTHTWTPEYVAELEERTKAIEQSLKLKGVEFDEYFKS